MLKSTFRGPIKESTPTQNNNKKETNKTNKEINK
jgi:hypothetical protein